jgi:hypothetical protein
LVVGQVVDMGEELVEGLEVDSLEFKICASSTNAAATIYLF